MSKVFTAKEMRTRANLESNTWGDMTTAAMLRQAADALEREEKRGGSELDGWRKQALEENAALDIAREQLAAKEAELARVMGDLNKLLKNGDLLCVQKVKLEREIEKRNALIRELADILKITSKRYFECEERLCAFCGKKCGRNEANRLIKEAREIAK